MTKELPSNFMGSALFTRVASILDTARERVVRSVNQEMLMAYWLIGHEIVEALQGGKARAEYGNRVLVDLSLRLTERYGKGFSRRNLDYFRRFYLTYQAPAAPIWQTVRAKSPVENDDLNEEQALTSIWHTARAKSDLPAFNAQLTWSHYKLLIQVEDGKSRAYYEQEAIQANWATRVLERQIATQFYERILSSKNKTAILASVESKRQNTKQQALQPVDVLKDPMILDFLNLQETAKLHESDLELAIINDLQRFLLELGRGFSFVARQQRLSFDDQDFYVDLVFYNYLLKCFVLIDLKIGSLTHQDIGQMDGYVRMYEERHKQEGDNPTLGLILCSQKNEAVARYSVLKESQQIFASKYLLHLPTEEQLSREIERQRALIEDRLSNRNDDTN